MPDLPPANRFLQAHAAGRDRDRALVMMAGRTRNKHAEETELQHPVRFCGGRVAIPMTGPDIGNRLKSRRAAELLDDKVFETQRNLMLPAAHFDAIGSDFS